MARTILKFDIADPSTGSLTLIKEAEIKTIGPKEIKVKEGAVVLNKDIMFYDGEDDPEPACFPAGLKCLVDAWNGNGKAFDDWEVGEEKTLRIKPVLSIFKQRGTGHAKAVMMLRITSPNECV